jgi:small ubiquitin-related modifier
MAKKVRDIWSALYAGRAWEGHLTIGTLLLQQLEIEWSQRADFFSLPKFKQDVRILENKRMEYKFSNDSVLFERFLVVARFILEHHNIYKANSTFEFNHLLSPADDLSVLSVFRMEEGSSVPMHEDRGILTFVYSPSDSSSDGESSFHIMAGSTLFACSNQTIPALTHNVPTVTAKYRYSFVFRLRGCSTAQVHKTGTNLSVGKYLSEFQTTRTSVNIPQAVEASEVGFVVNFSSSSKDNHPSVNGSDKSSNGNTITFIRNLVVKRDRDIADIHELHQDGSLTKDEVDILCNRSRDEFQDAKRQRIREGMVDERSVPAFQGAKKQHISEGTVDERSVPAATASLTPPTDGAEGGQDLLIKEETKVVAILSPSAVLNINTISDNSVITITIKVPNPHGPIFLKIKRSILMSSVFSQVCSQIQKSNEIVKFMHKGRKLGPEQTPSMVDMNDKDEIDCVVDLINENTPITVTVDIPNGEPIKIKIKQDSKMQRIFTAIASQLNLDSSSLKFTFKGLICNSEETPYSLEMKDGDVISCKRDCLIDLNSENDTTITVNVKTPNGERIKLKIKQDTKMQRIFTATADKLGLNSGDLRYMFDGRSLRDNDTPYSTEIQDGDVIDSYMKLRGD